MLVGSRCLEKVRRCEEPPTAQTQGTSAGRGEQKLEGGPGVPVLPEGRLGEHVAGGMEPRVHAEPWRRKGDPGIEPRTFLG